MIEFFKYHGTGNDFIMIDNLNGDFDQDKIAFAQKWCCRRFGVGSDGIIFLEKEDHLDYRMDFYNPDGSQSFCGNGSRCAMAFARFLGIVDTEANFSAIDGVHTGKFANGKYAIHMADVTQVKHMGEDLFIHTGSPHYISFCQKGDTRDIESYGKKIRFSEQFAAEGTNVNLVIFENDLTIGLRTYERGVEGETFACGTGATAAALAAGLEKGLQSGQINVHVKGGELSVTFDRDGEQFSNIWLIGPAEFVFKGSIDA